MRSSACVLSLATVCLFACEDGGALGDGGVDAGSVDSDGGIDAGFTEFERCPADGVSIEGTLDGEIFRHVSSGVGWYAAPSVDPTVLSADYGARGYLYVSTSTTYEEATAPATGLVIFPDDAPFGGQAYCVGTGSSMRQFSDGLDEERNALLNSLSPMGSCDDATVSTDRLSVCIGHGGGDCPTLAGGRARSVFSGVVRGESLEFTQDPPIVAVAESPNGDVSALIAGGRGILDLTPEGDHYVGRLIWRGEAPLDPLIVYCVTRAIVDLDASATRVEFEELKVRGDCAQPSTEVTGSVNLCF